MTAGDASAVALLTEQLGYATTPAVILERLQAFAVTGGHGCFVAEQNGVVVGWVDVFSVSMLISPRFFAEIGALVVEENARRNGIGRALVAHAEIWALERGYAEVRLRSGLHRAEAHEFYKSIGYELAKTSHMFRKTIS